MILVDSHCHLDMLEEYDSVENLVKRASDVGVKYIQTICTTLEDFPKILAIAEKHSNVFASVGVHPNEVKALTTAEELISLASNPKVIGLGETGLDYYYETSDRKLQLDSFHQHIIASQSTNLPVIIHMRDAEKDTVDLLRSVIKEKHFPGLIHCFTASKDFAASALDLGLYISIAGIVTFKNAEALREVVQYVPLERLLLETDAPYLAPVPKRGKTNEPAYTLHTAEFIANLKSIKLEEIAMQTTDNFFKLFTKARR